MSFENADGSCLNWDLQLRSRHSSALRTVSGFSSLVSAARERICLASAISVLESVAAAVEKREDGYGLDGRVGR